MSHYYTRWCDTHGEWDQDIDRPSDECPDCTAAGTAPSQLQAKELEALRTDYALLSDDYKQLLGDNERLRSRLAEAEALLRPCPHCGMALALCYDAKRAGKIACCPDCRHDAAMGESHE